MGGTGKIRLMTRFAWSRLGEYPGGVWFCDLSQARSVDGIYFAVAQGLDVPQGKTDPVVQLRHAIAGRGRCLVILEIRLGGGVGPSLVMRLQSPSVPSTILLQQRTAFMVGGDASES